MPLNCGDFFLRSRRVNLNSIMGTIAPTLHDFIILMNLPIGKLGYNEIQMILPIGTLGYNVRYTSEYIPKLQIHQHFLRQVGEVTRVHCVKQRNTCRSSKVEAIVNIPPRSIRKIQSLQGKSNFLRCFIINYAKITKGFMRLLNK